MVRVEKKYSLRFAPWRDRGAPAFTGNYAKRLFSPKTGDRVGLHIFGLIFPLESTARTTVITIPAVALPPNLMRCHILRRQDGQRLSFSISGLPHRQFLGRIMEAISPGGELHRV